MEVYHYRNNVDAYEEDGGLVNNPMLKHWFVLNVCDVILGEDAFYKYSPRELFEKLEEMCTSHEEYQNMLECKDAREVHDLMNPVVCDI